LRAHSTGKISTVYSTVEQNFAAKKEDRRIHPLHPANSAGQLTEKTMNWFSPIHRAKQISLSLRIRDRARKRELLDASAVRERRQ
jgi:hypothetical protein